MKTLLVSGCSMTHGAELFNGFMHPENIKLSYSQHLADRLNCDLLNVALSAGSNEYIFHSIMDNIDRPDIHSVIVMWTTTGRLYWKNNDRHYFFMGAFASSMIDPVNFKMHFKHTGDCWFTGDSNEIVDKISDMHKFFVTSYFDYHEERKKLTHYSEALKSACSERKLKFVERTLESYEITNNCIKTGRHPTADEHKQIADSIYREYYENF